MFQKYYLLCENYTYYIIGIIVIAAILFSCGILNGFTAYDVITLKKWGVTDAAIINQIENLKGYEINIYDTPDYNFLKQTGVSNLIISKIKNKIKVPGYDKTKIGSKKFTVKETMPLIHNERESNAYSFAQYLKKQYNYITDNYELEPPVEKKSINSLKIIKHGLSNIHTLASGAFLDESLAISKLENYLEKRKNIHGTALFELYSYMLARVHIYRYKKAEYTEILPWIDDCINYAPNRILYLYLKMDFFCNLKVEGVTLKDLFKEEYGVLLDIMLTINEKRYSPPELHYQNTASYMRYKENEKALKEWDKYKSLVRNTVPEYDTERKYIEEYFVKAKGFESFTEDLIKNDIRKNYKFMIENPQYEFLDIKVKQKEKIMNNLKYSAVLKLKMKQTGQIFKMDVAGVIQVPQ